MRTLAGEPPWRTTVLWMLTAYVFMLRRVPSECLPIVTCVGDCIYGPAQQNKAEIHVMDDQIVLCLKFRKNLPLGSKLTRWCWCKQCPRTCPVHVVGKLFKEYPVGSRPFACTSRQSALRSMRSALDRLEVPKPHAYRTHDLRRGHSEDILENGGSRAELLYMGEWSRRSAGYTSYINLVRLEALAVKDAHQVISDDEDDDEVDE